MCDLSLSSWKEKTFRSNRWNPYRYFGIIEKYLHGYYGFVIFFQWLQMFGNCWFRWDQFIFFFYYPQFYENFPLMELKCIVFRAQWLCK